MSDWNILYSSELCFGDQLQGLVLLLVSCVTLDKPVPHPLFKAVASFVRIWLNSARILSSRKQALKDEPQMTVFMFYVNLHV